MKKTIRTEYWEILNDFEDLIGGGYRTAHADPPPPVRNRPAAGTPGALHGDAAVEAPGAAPGTASLPRNLDALAELIRACRACRLGEMRTRAVPGEGNGSPRVLVIGEAPGAQEDQSGRPFVGRAGQYLDKWLGAIGLSRDENAFIANVIKCRPPDNRDPEEDEMSACLPYLKVQIETLNPEAILCVGRFAGRRITGEETSLGRLRGRTHRFDGRPVIVTYHPSAVLRNAELRRPVWEDLQLLKSVLEG